MRPNRKRIQRINIHPDEIGECEDEKDEDYRYLTSYSKKDLVDNFVKRRIRESNQI